jgi:PAS domain S-box-containing protein
MNNGSPRMEAKYSLTKDSSSTGVHASVLSGDLTIAGQLAAIVESSDDAIIGKTLEGTILTWNSSAERLYGYSAEEILGRPIDLLVPPDRTDESRDIFERLKKGKRLNHFETVRLRKDGRRIHVSLTVSPIKDKTGAITGASAIARDITARKQIEQELSAKAALVALLQAVAVASNEAPDAEAAIRACLELVCRYTGWPIGHAYLVDGESGPQLVPMRLWFLAEPERFQPFKSICESMLFQPGAGLPGQVLATAKPAWLFDLASDPNFQRRQIAARIGLKGGFAFPVLVGTEVASVLEFFSAEALEVNDAFLAVTTSIGFQLGRVIERARGDKTLRESEEHHRVIMETAADGIITIGQDSKILYANNNAGKIFGYSPSELIGQEVTILMPEYLRCVHKASLKCRQETGEKHVSWEPVELPGLHRSGREIPLEVSFGEFVANGSRAFTGVIRDIASRKHFDEQLRHAQKLESIGALAGGVAHDFNNLMTAVIGNISLALDRLPQSSTVRPLLDSALVAGERTADLTRQLLAYSGRGRFVLSPVDLSAVVREMSSIIRASVPRTVELLLDLQDHLPCAEADCGQIQQLFMNLVINGAEAIGEEESGAVSVTTRVQHIDERYIRNNLTGSDIRPGEYVTVEVHDTGRGMDEETKMKMFDPFFTTKFTGRGLGLAAVLGIVRGHKGGLEVHSSPGTGTTFKVLLPALEERPSAREAGHLDAQPAATGLILMIDDEDLIRRNAALSLERHGYSVLLAENGKVAVDMYRDNAARISVVS